MLEQASYDANGKTVRYYLANTCSAPDDFGFDDPEPIFRVVAVPEWSWASPDYLSPPQVTFPVTLAESLCIQTSQALHYK